MPQSPHSSTHTMMPASVLQALPLAALRLKAKQTQSVSDPANREEWELCRKDYAHFIRTHIQIQDSEARAWIPFDLWPAQEEVLELLKSAPLLAILKARQLGLTWLVLAYYLAEMMFYPIVNVLLFSKGESEAKHLMERLTGMYDHLPQWMKQVVPTGTPDSVMTWSLCNGSVARAFSTKQGDSYTATHALADEFDLVDNQGQLLGAIQPTIEAGGKLVLLSRVDKSKPMSQFKRTYQGAISGENGWRAVFLPWHTRPSRDVAWYEAKRRDILYRTGALDDLYEQYPGTPEEAISPRSLDKRIPSDFLHRCYDEAAGVSLSGVEGAPAIAGLTVFALPRKAIEEGEGKQPPGVYVIGADPAEGNPTSDPSPAQVLDKSTGEQVAILQGRFEPSVFAGHLKTLSDWYNSALMLIERNNHGHAVILSLRNADYGQRILRGTDGKLGWLTTAASKTAMYDELTVTLREGDAVIHSQSTYLQLASIDGSSLSAPKGMEDDEAMSFALANKARSLRRMAQAA